ncbi:endonuclease/exonuclease/phosphatase family protein [Streptomyces sp. NBC_01725]|uniref:endonuclease/exonuclease/phosphatase family protein n=1 Tax=Streptomyces sp. NBC_01725 TaxID=2975923 RepID=UPI002E2CB823|nr:endonuclease/exonuclease/phosphatase family protein [Streptomyces sp. NBC_01725]
MITRLKGRPRMGVALLGVTAALLALGAVPGSAAEPDRAPSSRAAGSGMFVGTFNIYGNVGHHGDDGQWIKDEADAIKDVVLGDTSRYLFIALQETCTNQVAQFASELDMKPAFVATGPTCANGQPYGNAILYHDGRVLPSDLLPNPDGRETRGIICVLIDTPATTVGCSTHLTDDSATNRAAQVKFINSDMNDGSDYRPEGHPLFAYGSVIIGGDFNATPWAEEMKTMYAGIEANGPRDTQFPHTYPTYDDGRKIDYLFTWDMRGPGTWSATGVQASPNSDHHFYYSKFTR